MKILYGAKNGVHEFGYNSTKSEPIWMKSGALRYLFSVSNSVCFYSKSVEGNTSTARTVGFDTQYRTLNVAENLGRYLSCAERTFQEKDFELVLTKKWKPDIP